MKSETLISWSIPNFITIVLMMGILWVMIGTAGHFFIRQPSMKRSTSTNTTTAPNGVVV